VFAIAIDSRKDPPRCAVMTMRPALGGPFRISSHSSALNSALPVIALPLSTRGQRPAQLRRGVWEPLAYAVQHLSASSPVSASLEITPPSCALLVPAMPRR